MTREIDLSSVVDKYATIDPDTETSIYPLLDDPKALADLEQALIDWINQQLTLNGLDKLKIQEQYVRLAGYFNPGSRGSCPPEVVWLNNQLLAKNSPSDSGATTEGKSTSPCCVLLEECYKKLSAPEQFKMLNWEGISNQNDLCVWLRELQQKPDTNSQTKSLCNSLLGLLEQSSAFFDETSKIKPEALGKVVASIPVAIAAIAAAPVAPDLFVVYALFYVTLKGGKRLKESDYARLQNVGNMVSNAVMAGATLTTTAILYLLGMVFWTSNFIAGAVGKTLTTDKLSQTIAPPKTIEDLAKTLNLVTQGKIPGRVYKEAHIKIIALVFEQYLIINKKQILQPLRLGATKEKLVDDLFLALRVIDNREDSLLDKLNSMELKLQELAKNKTLCTATLEGAINNAMSIVKFMQQSYRAEELAEPQYALGLR